MSGTVNTGSPPKSFPKPKLCLLKARKRVGNGFNRASSSVSERDGESYGKELWELSGERLQPGQVSSAYRPLKVWWEGLEAVIPIEEFQGTLRVAWLKAEHPFTAISPTSHVHAHHNEALNRCLRCRCSADRRRQNHCAKTVAGLQRAVTVQWLIHNLDQTAR